MNALPELGVRTALKVGGMALDVVAISQMAAERARGAAAVLIGGLPVPAEVSNEEPALGVNFIRAGEVNGLEVTFDFDPAFLNPVAEGPVASPKPDRDRAKTTNSEQAAD